ncbi:MAG TPA: hypothetical protein VMF10_02200 [Candidatus Aquilonibacter sp.]|nr:hypothetical protein [Candidatus Aquilonibacter sp.]
MPYVLAALAGALRYGRPVEQSGMFKISTVDTESQRRLLVEGTLVGPWISGLRIAWSNARRDLNGRKVVIDVGSLTVISREGKDAIFDLMKQGAKFSSGGICTKYMVKRLAREYQGKLGEDTHRADYEMRVDTDIALRR